MAWAGQGLCLGLDVACRQSCMSASGSDKTLKNGWYLLTSECQGPTLNESAVCGWRVCA